MPPDLAVIALAKLLSKVLQKEEPQDQLNIISNVIGITLESLTDEQWDALEKCKPRACGTPDCECDKHNTILRDFLLTHRKQATKTEVPPHFRG